MPANANFDNILSTTLYNYRETLTDNIFKANPLTAWLLKKDNFEKEPGGAKLIEPIIGVKNTDVGSYVGYDALTTTYSMSTTNSVVDAAEYDWKQFYGTVGISGIEEAKNRGEHAILSLMKAKMMQTEESMKEAMNAMFHGDGTGNSAKDWSGLQTLIDATSTIGNINRTTGANSWWRSTVDTTTEALTLAKMTSVYNSVSRGNDVPDLLIGTQTLHEKYESLLQPQLRFSDNAEADGGFLSLLFKGATFFFDFHCAAGTLYMLNSKYIKLKGHSDVWFEPTQFVKPTAQDARVAQILAYGNLVLSNSARHAKLTNKS